MVWMGVRAVGANTLYLGKASQQSQPNRCNIGYTRANCIEAMPDTVNLYDLQLHTVKVDGAPATHSP